ncbi:MAG: hypothetical protein U9R49_15005 [Bacteroidota bacterium]|nr:hypothetical protein [Bacteroidota bacterium]
MNQRKSEIWVLLLLILLSILISCNPPRNTYSSDPDKNKAAETSRILFLNYQLTRDSTLTNYNAHLINMIIREGKIKDVRERADHAEKDDLELLVLDRNQQPMTRRRIPNPLDRSVEYVNDAGQLEYKMIHLDSAQFSIRLQIEPGASSILLNRFTGNVNEGTLLLKTQIQ